MNKKYLKIFILSALFIAIGVFVLPHFAFAEEAKIDNNTLLGGISKSVVNTVLSSISYYILTVTSSLVTISGVLLSLSIKLTLSIGKIYDDIEGIRTIWRTIRDLSSIFIIFILLFESIKMILGLKGQGFNQTVVKIFIAGMLINFSLVFCKMTIDASNLVSIQFYNAITPGTSQTLDLSIKSIFNDGGLSNVFMQSLKIPRIYNSVKFSKDADVAMSILVATAGGIIMMITASFSFFAAAIAFTVRTGLLLFIMALSPLYFAGIIFPEIKRKVSDNIFGLLVSQSLFMPAYLFLMYIALRLISDDGFMKMLDTTNSANTSGVFGTITIGITIQYIIALIFINAPLLMAIEFGAIGMKWAPQVAGISKNLGGILGNFASATGQHTIGRVAKFTSGKLSSSEFATKNPNLAILTNKGLSKISGASFGGSKGGYDKRLKEYSKTISDFGSKNIKLTSKNQQDIDDELEKLVYPMMMNWGVETARMRDALKAKTDEYNRSILSNGENNPETKKIKEQLEKMRVEYNDRKTFDIEGKKKELRPELEKKYTNKRKEEFAKSVESGFNPITKKADKDAADTIRKEIKTSKKDRTFNDLLSFIKDETKDEDKKDGDKK